MKRDLGTRQQELVILTPEISMAPVPLISSELGHSLRRHCCSDDPQSLVTIENEGQGRHSHTDYVMFSFLMVSNDKVLINLKLIIARMLPIRTLNPGSWKLVQTKGL